MNTSFGAPGLGLGLLCALIFLYVSIGRLGLAKRPVPLLLAGLGMLPALIVLASFRPELTLGFLRFERPLASLGAAIVLAWIAIRLLRLSPRLTAARRLSIEIGTALSALCAAFAMLGLELGRPLDRLTVVLAIDRSRSIELVSGAESRIRKELSLAELGMREDDRIATVAFGALARVEDPARPRSGLASPQRADVPRDGTDIAAGIRAALAEIPPDSAARVVVISDGVATRGDALEAALAASALGVPIDVIPLDQGKVPDIRVRSVRVAPRASEGEALDLRVVTESSSDDASVRLRVYRDGELIREGRTRIGRGEDLVHLREIAPGPGLHRYDVEISADEPALDRSVEDNTGAAFVRVKGPSTALVLESDPAIANPLKAALASSAFHVDVKGPASVPADVAEFARYDFVVLGDISATDLAPSQIDALASYVRDLGGGLLLLGGDQAMGPGGYARTSLEEVSPVSFDLKQERRRASLAEVIIVDYSGSMAMSVGGNTKLELANEAAARSAALLGIGDRLGVMHVDTVVRWTVPLDKLGDASALAAKIRAVGPGGGGIFIDLALNEGYAALDRENVQLKHVLLFSDGGDAEERTNAFTLAQRAKGRGITTSVVALGNGSDVPALARIAELGAGRFYLVEDATRLPSVFAQETILASRSAINEVEFVPEPRGTSKVLAGVDFTGAPPLTGYVVTIPKARAQVLLAGPENDPILAIWSAGVGRAGAFTSDYKDRWGARWTEWDGAARLFAQLGRELSRRVDDPRVRFEADIVMGELSARASVLDARGRGESLRRLRARIAGPGGFSHEVLLDAVGSGSYSANASLSRPGAYVVTLIDDETSQALATTGAVLSAGEELRPTGTDRALLRRLTEVSGGVQRDTLAGVFHDRAGRRFAYDPLSAWLLMMAGAGLVSTVAFRRVAFDPTPPKPSLAGAGAPSTHPKSDRDSGGSPTFAALRSRKARGDTGRAENADRTELALPPSPVPARVPSEPKTGEPTSGRAEPRQVVTRQKSAAEILLERRRKRLPK